MTSETIKLNLIPGGELPVLHASQFDIGRALSFIIYDGDTLFTSIDAYDISMHVRKVDGTVIGIDTYNIDSETNEVIFFTTEQLTACAGKNIGELVFSDSVSGSVVGTCNFWLEVECDPYAGGIDSASDIENISTQIAAIVDSQLDNYYTKEEIDEQIEDIVTEQVTPIVTSIVSEQVPPIVQEEMTDYYTKSETDSAFYNKGQVDTLLSGKADTSDLPDMTNYYDKTTTDTLLASKANTSTTYTKTEVDNLIAAIPSPDITTEITTSAATQTFTDGGDDIPLKSLTTDITLTQSGSGTPTPSNIRPITGHSNCVVTVSDGDSTTQTTTINLGSTIYGGSLECVNGNGTVTKGVIKLNDLEWTVRTSGSNNPNGTKFNASGDFSMVKGSSIGVADVICNVAVEGNGNYSTSDANTLWFSNSRTTMGWIWGLPNQGSSLSDLETFLNNNDIYVVFDLATNTSLSTTPANINTLSGTNEISTDCGNITELEYFNNKADDIAALINLMNRS
jgi:hypothetical protein